MKVKTSHWLLVLSIAMGGGTPVFAQAMDTKLRAHTELFGLEAALTATLAHHPALAGKTASVQARDFAAEAARTQRYPSVSGQVQQLSRSMGSASARPDNPASLRVRQALWAFGRIDSAIALADAETGAEKADRLRLQRQLIDNTAMAYAKVHGLMARQKVLLENEADLRGLRDQIVRREVGQLASGADVRLVNSRLIQAATLKARAAGDLEVARADLLALTQIPVSAAPSVAPRFTELRSAAELETLAQEHSADVVYKNSQIGRARAAQEQVRTAAMPTVYLQAEQFFNQPSYVDDRQVGVVLEANLEGMGLASINRTRGAGAQVTVAEEDLRATRNDLARTIHGLYANRQAQRSMALSLADSVQELGLLLKSYLRQYEAGTKSWLDVLNLQRELIEQRLQQVQAESDGLTYSLRLRAMTGGFDELLGISSDIDQASVKKD